MIKTKLQPALLTLLTILSAFITISPTVLNLVQTMLAPKHLSLAHSYAAQSAEGNSCQLGEPNQDS